MGRFREWQSRWRPGPSLDRDPVLWREWHRSRPSRVARIVWGAFILLSLASTAGGVVELARYPNRASEFLVFANGFQVTFGLLLLSLTAPTVLAEERVRGSLDVLLTTPLPTDRIVLAKWWGAYRVVPALALLPAIGSVFLAVGMPDVFPGFRRFGQAAAPLDLLDRVAFVVLPMALLLVQGALIASIGLALATWSRRIGRAVALSVAAYGLVAFLGPILLEIVPEILVEIGFFQDSCRVGIRRRGDRQRVPDLWPDHDLRDGHVAARAESRGVLHRPGHRDPGDTGVGPGGAGVDDGDVQPMRGTGLGASATGAPAPAASPQGRRTRAACPDGRRAAVRRRRAGAGAGPLKPAGRLRAGSVNGRPMNSPRCRLARRPSRRAA